MHRFLLSLFVFLGFVLPAAAQFDVPKARVQLIADRDAVRPGSTFTIAVEQDIDDGWHTYWSNPGEAGQPVMVKWTLPPGWKAGALQWPYPKRVPTPPLMDYGYEGTVWLLSDVTVPADAKPGAVRLEALVQWLVCRDVCIPEEAKVQAVVVVDPAAAGADGISAADFATARAKIPAVSPWPTHYVLDNDLRLYVEAEALADTARPKDVQFFPAKSGLVIDAAVQSFESYSGGLVVRLQPGEEIAKEKLLTGVLVLTSADKSVQALEVHAAPGAPPPVPATRPTNTMSLWLALIFAAFGGLILNVMPCVLPVLAMKALALTGNAGADRAHARAESFFYSLGAVLSFVAFGLLVSALRAGGESIGWGFQLQEPVVVAVLAMLMVAVGLNMSGVFEIAPVSAGEALTRRGGFAGAFFTGVLAVAVAAPCTAPFMATAIGYSFTQETPVVIAVFVTLGLGFALPFILLGIWPSLHRWLPKPGKWMVRLKELLALPMYGAAVWLVWVLSQQVDQTALVAALGAMAAGAMALWIWGRTQIATRYRWVGYVLSGLSALSAAALLTGFIVNAHEPVAPPTATHAGIASEPYTPERLEALRKQNRPVFVDATASWCITCLVNEEAALSQPAVRDAFKRKNIVLLVADWTNRNPEITALLDKHGRSGVPLYLYYAPGAAEPEILPQILTEGIVLKALAD